MYWLLFPKSALEDNADSSDDNRLGDTVSGAALAMFRRMLAEFIGTLLLVYFVAGLQIEYFRGLLDPTAVGLGSGLCLIAIIYAFGETSGVSCKQCARTGPILWLNYIYLLLFAVVLTFVYLGSC